jgi:uncharacterized protein YdeI (YjbR/CyaY-like superfamily)
LKKKKIKIVYPKSPAAWRRWLEKNHQTEQAVWLVFYSKKSGKPSLTWSVSVDIALCFGWIDSKKIKIDEETIHHYFSQRKPKSTWSKVNKEKVEKLAEQGLLNEAGLRSIEMAKENGSWSLLEEVENLIVPPDLEEAFAGNPKAKEFYLSLSKSNKKIILTWLVFAKTIPTRRNRITEIIERGNQQLKPTHIR